MQSASLLISSAIQVILLSIIPFAWWVLTKRKEVSFLHWIGIKKPIIVDKKKYALSFSMTIILYLGLAFIIPLLLVSSETATSEFAGQGISALLPALIYAFLQTGLSEEIFFRGFLTKVLSGRYGFKLGNSMQAIIFGLIHGMMFISDIGYFKAIIIVLITGIIGLLMGWINEKQAGGSIIPSWLLHGLANMISAIIVMFNL